MSDPPLNLTSLTSSESVEDATSCFNRTTNSGFTVNFVTFKKSVNIYFVGLAIVVGLIGNTLSVVVLRHDRQADAKQRSSTNHLLRMLAIVDSLYLVTCLFIQTLKTIIENTEWFPGSPLRHHYLHSEPLVWMLSSAAQTSTVWLVLLVTLDRYLAVCKPWKSRMRSSRDMALLVAILGFLALLYNTPRYFERVVITKRLCGTGEPEAFNTTGLSSTTTSNLVINIHPRKDEGPEYLKVGEVNDESTTKHSDFPSQAESLSMKVDVSNCFQGFKFHPTNGLGIGQSEKSNLTMPKAETVSYVTRTMRTDFRFNKLYFLLYKTIFYFVFRSFGPLLLLLYFNWRLISDLRKVRKRRRDMLSRRVQHKENITVMLVVVVTVFIICQIPALGVRVAVTIMEFNHDIHLDLQVLRYINELSNALLTLNSSINFIIYCLVGKKFQKSFMSIISCAARNQESRAPDEGTNQLNLKNSISKITFSEFKMEKKNEELMKKVTEAHLVDGSFDCVAVDVVRRKVADVGEE